MNNSKAAFVTGAGKRIGQAIALGLARSGFDVVLHYGQSAQQAQDTAVQIEALGRKALCVQADLSQPQAIALAWQAAINAMPHLQLVVNSASRFEYDDPVSFHLQHLAEHMPVNVAAPVQLSQLLYQHMQQQGDGTRGAVVNLVDQKLANLNPDFFSYTLTKAALLSATQMMAMHFAPLVRVNAVSPGATMVSWKQSEDGFSQANQIALLDRSSIPEDLVQAVLYLAQAPAVTGVNLIVDGGQHLMPLDRDVMFLTKQF
jgi:NAD(P)-dependent dehydrogenase (short-subunit alcohol dehydrogenase family)